MKKIVLALFAVSALLLIALIVSLVRCASLDGKYRDLKTLYDEDEEYISAKNSRVFHYAGEKQRMYTILPGYGEVWTAALSDMPLHELDLDAFKDRDGRIVYEPDGEVQSLFGIDVSYHNGDIDWERVKADGVDFAFLRVGYRGYESGKLNVDDRFHEYAKGATDAGIDIGVYLFSQALTDAEALEEADFVLHEIEGYDIKYPVVFDWEMIGGEDARTDDISVEDLDRMAALFCNSMAEHGYIPMVYLSKIQGMFKYDLDTLAGFDMWLAEYRDRPSFPYMFTVWQYASDGHVDGIEGTVDMDISFVDYSKERR